MRLRYASDLHLEQYEDIFLGQRNAVSLLLDELSPQPEDSGLILAGDLVSFFGEDLEFYLRQLCARWATNGGLFYGPGNHEFWNSSHFEVFSHLHKLEGEIRGLHLLDCNVHEVGGARILGTTLWYNTERRDFPDFRYIGDHDVSVGGAFKRERAFLEENLQENDIVVTHYLPSWQCVRPRWVGSRVNDFYVSDYEDLILERKPAFWIHGHTHDAYAMTLGSTRILCNPLGRPEENTDYDPSRYIEV